MKIGDVSTKLGIPASTIRYYEQAGLIYPPPRVSGRRKFDERTILALEFVRLAQAAGFTIAETKSLLETYAQDQSASGAWKTKATKKRSDVRKKIQALQQVDAILSELIACKCASLTECIKIGLSRNLGEHDADH